MPILSQLKAIYETRGFRIVTGITAYFSNSRRSEATHLLGDQGVQGWGVMTHHMGITLKEVYFLENLFQVLSPASALVIGNSFGWSTFAVSLLNPDANVVAVEAGEEEFTAQWIEHTNRIAGEEGLAVTVLKGRSPDLVPEAIRNHLKGSVEFAFIDGDHSHDAMLADYRAIRKFATPRTVYMFHDVALFNLHDAARIVAEESGLRGRLLWATDSGIFLVFDATQHPALERLTQDFGGDELSMGILNAYQKMSS